MPGLKNKTAITSFTSGEGSDSVEKSNVLYSLHETCKEF